MSAAHRLAASPRLTIASTDNGASSRRRAAAHSAKLDERKRKGSRSGEGNAFWQVIWNYGKLDVVPPCDPH